MHRYRVVGLSAEDGKCVIRSSTNRYHLVRSLGRRLGLNMVLLGDPPHLGFGILVCEVSGAIFRVIFDSINDPEPAPRAGGTPSKPPTQWRAIHARVGGDD